MHTHSATAIVLTSLLSLVPPASVQAQTLEGFASFPADTFAPGPTSGQFITPANGRTPPFVDSQPVQGMSSVLRASNGDFLVMSDNGFGAKNNSADYVLRVYRISPDFRTEAGGSGDDRHPVVLHAARSRSPHQLSHRRRRRVLLRRAPFPSIRPSASSRLLTGADFDIESFREAPDGTLWFGDEFGPFLLHTDRDGRVLESAVSAARRAVAAESVARRGTPNLPVSRGFEGMAITPDGKTLYPMLEGALTTDADQQRLIINQFDLRKREYTGRQWFYRLEATGQAIGDFTAVDQRHDSWSSSATTFRAPRRAFKKIYRRRPGRGGRRRLSRQARGRRSAADRRSAQPRWPRAGLPVSVPDDRERDPAEQHDARRARRQQLPVQQRTRRRASPTRTSSSSSVSIGRSCTSKDDDATRRPGPADGGHDSTPKRCHRLSTDAGFFNTRGHGVGASLSLALVPGQDLFASRLFGDSPFTLGVASGDPDAGRHRPVDAAGAGAGRSRSLGRARSRSAGGWRRQPHALRRGARGGTGARPHSPIRFTSR